MKASGVGLVTLLVMALAGPAFGHRDVGLTICVPYYRGAGCAPQGKNAPTPSYVYGDSVPVKGRVEPAHGGTVRIQRTQRQLPWRTVARVPLEGGRYRFLWHTTRRDADQGRPFRFRAVLPDHDTSPVRGSTSSTGSRPTAAIPRLLCVPCLSDPSRW